MKIVRSNTKITLVTLLHSVLFYVTNLFIMIYGEHWLQKLDNGLVLSF